MRQYFVVGTYTEPILFGTGQVFQGQGKGLYLCSFEEGAVHVEDIVPLRNPSYFCLDEKKGKIYAVNETKEFQGLPGGGITEITYSRGNKLNVVRSLNTGGADPCHIARSPDGTFIAVANFAGGSVATFPLSEAGEILPDRQLYKHVGSSINPVRQQAPHPHSIIFDSDNHMIVPDLGTDQLFIYPCVKGGITTEGLQNLSLPGGNGPRFGQYTADECHFYLINELASSVTHFINRSGTLHRLGTVGTLPAGEGTENICSDLHLTPDGQYLYASNRGHDSLTSFRVDPQSGELSLIEQIPCGGKTPRNFCIEPRGGYLLVGNQESNSITVFSIGKDGKLTEKSHIAFPSPVCIQFLESTTSDTATPW